MYGSSNWFACVVCGAVIQPGSMLVVAAQDQDDGTPGQPAAFDEEHWPRPTGEWRILYEGKAENAPADLRR